MATVAQPPVGQPMFVPPRVAPQVATPMPAMAAPGNHQIMYYPQMAGGAVIVPVIATQPPNYEYIPNDFMVLSLITVILCGIFSPLSLLLSLPALFFSWLSRKNAVIGAIKVARKQGIVAAYLNVAAIVAALVVACVVMGFIIGFLGPPYVRCIKGYDRSSCRYIY